MKVQCRGVRGSIPVAGESTSKYGGNSSCVEIRAKDGPPLILDCGTGIRSAGLDFMKEGIRDVEILFTHFHMDHLFGFPFFVPLYVPNCQVNVSMPAHNEVDAQNKLMRYLNGVYHPLRIRDIPATINFKGIRPGQVFERGPYRIKGISLNHPGGSCGYRIECEGKIVLYLTDTAPMTRPNEGISVDKAPPAPEKRLLQALEGADLVIMDTMFSFDEYLERITWGHAYPEYAVKICELARAKRLVLFHHAPDYSDDILDDLAAKWAVYENLDVSVAQEGKVIDLSE